MDKYIVLFGRCIVEQLNVRSQPNKESNKIGYLSQNEKVQILEETEEWIKIQYEEEQIGYVFAKFLSRQEEFLYAKTIEEIEEIKKK